jgi:putative oxidoreductase
MKYKNMKKIHIIIFKTTDDYRSVLPRVIVGLIFLSEGIQKFLFPDLAGAGRFEKIGFANPEFLASFVASFEIVCGTLILIGLSVRIAAIPLLIIMITAITTTKIPVLLEKGFWSMAHEARTDFAMTLLLIYLLIFGSGKWSVDSKINKYIKT